MIPINNSYELLANEPYTEREAWGWLLENINLHKCYKKLNGKIYQVNVGQLVISNRMLAKIWQWGEAKVRRFLARLESYRLIDAQPDSHGTVLTIGESYITKQSSQADVAASDTVATHRHLNDDSLKVTVKSALNNNADLIMTHRGVLLKKKEDKEKNQKKKKKEKKPLKEKNTPFRSIKKEKVSLNFGLSEKKGLKQLNAWLEEMKTELVEEWARNSLPEDIDLKWELDKFKDYWRAYRSKPPKDGVAALRNWLRNSVEFTRNNNLRRKNEQDTANRANRKSGHDRLFAASARIIAKLNGIQLDRNNESMGNSLFKAGTDHLQELRTLPAVTYG